MGKPLTDPPFLPAPGSASFAPFDRTMKAPGPAPRSAAIPRALTRKGFHHFHPAAADDSVDLTVAVMAGSRGLAAVQ